MENNENINKQEGEPAAKNLIEVSLPATSYSKRENLNLQLRLVTIRLEDLILNASIYGLFGINPNEYYNQAFEYFGKCHSLPHVAKADNEWYVLSNKEVVMAANNCGLHEISAIQVIGLDINTFPEFINYSSFYMQKDYKNLYDISQVLENHFRNNPMGKEWFNGIPGDMKKTLATVLNTSESTIQNIRQIGNNDRDDLIKIDSGELTFTGALSKVRPQKNDSPSSKENQPAEKKLSHKQKTATPTEYTVPVKEEGPEDETEHEPVMEDELHSLSNENLYSIQIGTKEWGNLEIIRGAQDSGRFFQINPSGGGSSDEVVAKIINHPDGRLTYCFQSINKAGSFEITFKNFEAFYKV